MGYVDDIVKALAEDEKADEAKPAETKPEPPKPAELKKEEKKTEKKEDKKADDEVPMDNAAIKAYSSVIADAAEDSEPSTPVIYSEIKDEARPDSRLTHAPM